MAVYAYIILAELIACVGLLRRGARRSPAVWLVATIVAGLVWALVMVAGLHRCLNGFSLTIPVTSAALTFVVVVTIRRPLIASGAIACILIGGAVANFQFSNIVHRPDVTANPSYVLGAHYNSTLLSLWGDETSCSEALRAGGSMSDRVCRRDPVRLTIGVTHRWHSPLTGLYAVESGTLELRPQEGADGVLVARWVVVDE